MTLVLLGLCSLAAADDYPVDVSPEELFAPVFAVENGRVVAEAETLIGNGYGKEWQVSKAEGYHAEGEPPSGGSFVVARRDRQGGGMLTVDQHAKLKSLGDKESWLQFRFHVGPGQEGTYTFGWRQAHIQHDGDNDVFPAALGADEKDVARGGWGPTRRFNWYTNGVTLEASRPGVYGFVLISRSSGYAVDRVVSWKGDGRGVPDSLQDLNLPESPRWLSVKGLPEVERLVQANAYGRAWNRLSTVRDHAEATQARRTLEACVAARLAELVALKESDPARAVAELERCARRYRGIPLAKEMAETARAWAKEPDVRKAVSAQRGLVEFRKHHASLLRALRGRRLSDPQVRRQMGRKLTPLLGVYQALKRFGPTPSLAEARAALTALGIEEPTSP